MFISLIICTYKRADSLNSLLKSVFVQEQIPDEIIIVDGSPDNETENLIKREYNESVLYFHVNEENRGLTRQRNFGISKISNNSDVVSFLDDDTVLTPSYFKVLKETFKNNPEVGGVGGVAINEDYWKKIPSGQKLDAINYYSFEGYYTKEPLRNKVRNLLHLNSPLNSFQMGDFSHVRASGYPLTGKFYEVDLLIGMSFSFRKEITDQLKFSLFFDGYGLYEDADYSIRALKFGRNVMHTGIQLYHYHHPSGRPNTFKYGKMVIRNGYYVWKLKYPDPGSKAVLKWHITAFLLTLIRGLNLLTGPERLDAFREFLGRITGWFSLWGGNSPIPKED